METTESTQTNSEVLLPADAIANQEPGPVKVSAADNDDAELDDINRMLLGEVTPPEDGAWDKDGVWVPKASEEMPQPKSVKDMPRVPKEKRKREDEEPSTNKKQEREDRELSAYMKQKACPSLFNPTIVADSLTGH